MMSLEYLNGLDADAFVAALGGVFEHASWIPARAAARRPFATVTDLHEAMMGEIAGAQTGEVLAFLRGHPELAGKVARAGAMTAESISEQGGLGLDRLSDAEFARFEVLNGAYRDRFGFPFIICVRRHTRDSILDRFERRLANGIAAERAASIAEIGFISRLRLTALVIGPGMPVTTGRLSTRVVDTTLGRPAAGMTISLHEIGASGQAEIVSTVTNADGCTDRPLIDGAPLRIGTYELRFEAGGYFAALGLTEADPPYLGTVPIRFSITEPEAHYHVPLLVSPWSYTTWRGH